MKRLIFLILAASLAATATLYAQERDRNDFEPSIGIGLPTQQVHGLAGAVTLDVGFDYRHSFWDVPIWLGVGSELQYTIPKDGCTQCRPWRLMTYTGMECRIADEKKIKPFVGAAVGWMHQFKNDTESPLPCNYAVLLPKVGVMFGPHLRLTFEDIISPQYLNIFNLRVGWAF